MISIIVAIDKNRAIGKQGKLPWRLSADLANFKRLTSGHPIIMGRKTFDSIGRPLPKRHNIVVTRDLSWWFKSDESFYTISSLDKAIEFSKTLLSGQKSDVHDEIFIIGGGEIYKQTIGLADKLYVTEVDAEISEADIFFPDIDKSIWKEVKRESFPPNEKNEYGYSFVVYDKI